ncbi:MAG TPA: winged helix-turn-helix domain-containing protein, partial [Thermomicrobiales bacterium]|nr:winged helix-turn-helix domain-containing protein [Thermomicrobiales bacterium]
ILDGDPPLGGRLPPERRLAKLLGVNRTTVVNAYRELAADGLVSGQVGRGTIVIHGAPEAQAAPANSGWPRVDANGDRPSGYSVEAGRSRATPIPWAQLFTATTDVMDDPLLRDAMTVSARPDVIRLATGIPSPELYPIDD